METKTNSRISLTILTMMMISMTMWIPGTKMIPMTKMIARILPRILPTVSKPFICFITLSKSCLNYSPVLRMCCHVFPAPINPRRYQLLLTNSPMISVSF